VKGGGGGKGGKGEKKKEGGKKGAPEPMLVLFPCWSLNGLFFSLGGKKGEGGKGSCPVPEHFHEKRTSICSASWEYEKKGGRGGGEKKGRKKDFGRFHHKWNSAR